MGLIFASLSKAGKGFSLCANQVFSYPLQRSKEKSIPDCNDLDKPFNCSACETCTNISGRVITAHSLRVRKLSCERKSLLNLQIGYLNGGFLCGKLM